MSLKKKIKKLHEQYAKVPSANCKGLCHEACAFVMCGDLEKKIISEKHGNKEMLQAECPYLLTNKKCGIYDDRPLVCRFYGVVPGLPCPFGCEPDATLSATQASKIFNKVTDL